MMLAAALLGCGGAAAQRQPSSSEPPSRPDAEPDAGPATSLPAPSGTIARADLVRVLDTGPAQVLALVDLEPVREDGRFVGFSIAEFRAEAPGPLGLRVGDVVVSVNGRKIERPEHYFEIFQELRVASELRFEILREGAPRALSYPITD